MRRALGFTLIGILGLCGQIVACAEGQNFPASQGGSGNRGGAGGGDGGQGGDTGGAGGSECTTEVCDGKDNDCNGEIDEGCECIPGETEACYTGPVETNNVGTCKPGMRACDTKTNMWGTCNGEILPGTEICNGLDEDCNGTADDGIAEIVCGVGACMMVVPGCADGKEGTCIPGQPTIEICDGLDNDCDQLTDESFPENNKMCDTGTPGICSKGTSKCAMGTLLCEPMNMPSMETCDSLDNDCNGTVDDGITGTGIPCSTGQMGVCSMGTTSCQNNVIDCFPNSTPSAEKCDGLDNDCNGMVDENNPEAGNMCMTGMAGACAAGISQCNAGVLSCKPNNSGVTELCNNQDDNCNGQVDEGNPNNGVTCTCGGNSTCVAGKLECNACTKEINCNDGKNNDSDNQIDCMDTDCNLGCAPMVGACAAGETLFVVTSNDVPKAIPDPGTTTSNIMFSEIMTVKRVVLQVNITHTFDADVEIFLTSPSNTTVLMSDDNGSVSDNYTDTIFHTGCTTAITAGFPPFNGCYVPEQSLTAFINQPLNGTWKLTAGDDTPNDSGTLNSWTLAICAQ